MILSRLLKRLQTHNIQSSKCNKVVDFDLLTTIKNTIGLDMNFTNIKNRIKNAYIDYGKYRTAIELSRFSTSQLAEIGISKQLLSLGTSAYPWRLEGVSQEIPDNITMLNTRKSVTVTPIISMISRVA